MTIVLRRQGSSSILAVGFFHLCRLIGRLALIRGQPGISLMNEQEAAVLAETMDDFKLFYPACILFGAMLANQGWSSISSSFGRCSGIGLRSLPMRSFASADISVGHCIFWRRILWQSSSWPRPWNGGLPVSISKSRIPSDHTSNDLC